MAINVRILWQFEWVKIDTYKHYFQQNSKRATIYKSASKQNQYIIYVIFIILVHFLVY